MAAEIDEFLSSVEKKEQQRFSDKYNFDIVNDVPMDGSLNGLIFSIELLYFLVQMAGSLESFNLSVDDM
ncbi:hypothetical protein L1987_70793 [Smallanthus sonchifolius]|uniref:Uncharacterized protein n=1 Tax=Smallanthus sonchifolius TaxID=185202 RepID=A0ACB9AQV4_9ASTR|nr:hypothetical protein L1987_70793 [Smallanthus sonchifolius]